MSATFLERNRAAGAVEAAGNLRLLAVYWCWNIRVDYVECYECEYESNRHSNTRYSLAFTGLDTDWHHFALCESSSGCARSIHTWLRWAACWHGLNNQSRLHYWEGEFNSPAAFCMQIATHIFILPLSHSLLESHTTAVRVLAEEWSADQLLRLQARHLHWDHTGSTHPEPAHHTRAANHRLRQLHLLRQQHRASKHLRLCIKRWESQGETERGREKGGGGGAAVRGFSSCCKLLFGWGHVACYSCMQFASTQV